MGCQFDLALEHNLGSSTWHNIAYVIDFDTGTVTFYHSTGADDLAVAVPAVSVSASPNGADWRLDVLELPRHGCTDSTEDIYFSGVYVESGELTTSVSGPHPQWPQLRLRPRRPPPQPIQQRSLRLS
jgi:hypothetical protein